MVRQVALSSGPLLGHFDLMDEPPKGVLKNDHWRQLLGKTRAGTIRNYVRTLEKLLKSMPDFLPMSRNKVSLLFTGRCRKNRPPPICSPSTGVF